MNTIKNISGKLIRAERMALSMSQDALSNHLTLLGLNIDQSAISRIENGSREVYDYELYCICRVLKIDINSFFERDLLDNIPQNHNPPKK